MGYNGLNKNKVEPADKYNASKWSVEKLLGKETSIFSKRIAFKPQLYLEIPNKAIAFLEDDKTELIKVVFLS